jgi:alpha-tubulin suppressor-like RCC1 family protein
LGADYYHSLVLRQNGKVYAAGDGSRGMHGLGDTADKHVFTEVTGLNGKNIAAISAGSYCSFALSRDGKVYATGNNTRGQLGLGDYFNRIVFTPVPSLNDDKTITAISTSSGEHTLAIDNTGKLYATGRAGMLGLGNASSVVFRRVTRGDITNNTIITAVFAGTVINLALDSEGKIYTTRSDNVFHRVTDAALSGVTITAIAAGEQSYFALSNTGKVYVAGRNDFGQLGLGDITKRDVFTEITVAPIAGKTIIAIAAGVYHSFVMDSDGNIYATGRNNYGQLGVDYPNEKHSFTLVPF